MEESFKMWTTFLLTIKVVRTFGQLAGRKSPNLSQINTAVIPPESPCSIDEEFLHM